jgi:pullulanase-type alpha-1,6-glucosidase
MKIQTPNLMLSVTYTALAATFLLSACSDKKHINSSELTVTEIVTLRSELSKPALQDLPFDSSAHWLTAQVLVLPKSDNNFHYQLANIDGDNAINAIDLIAITLPEHLTVKFPHLAEFQAYQVSLSPETSKLWLKKQLMVVALDTTKQAKKVAYVQTGGVIDALYTQNNNDADEVSDLGATITYQGNSAEEVSFKLWAPTAQKVEVFFFNDDLTPVNSSNTNNAINTNKIAQLTLVEDSNTGVWQAVGDSSLNGAYYQYKVTVYHPASKKIESLFTTDPYSLSLSTNSEFSQVVDLNDESTKPLHWEEHQVPVVKNSEDNIFYETHIRDFSSDDSALSNNAHRGKYKAFSEQNSNGINHIKALGAAGLNNIHLLPAFDIATVDEEPNKAVDLNDTIAQIQAKVCQRTENETVNVKNSLVICKGDFNEQQTLKSLLESYKVSGTQAQKLVSELREFDNFNWGYDPYHYTVPEGSYAVNPQGIARLVEFREMVQSIHGLGFRVIMDVVYNHTHQSGLEPNAVLDKIVPNYYHRLDPITAAIEQSTCCDNTATERVMMAKLMTDSLVVWARDYKIDGFRFDLMGHQPKAAMLTAREAVRAVDNDTYFYGEGWNFGEVANNQQFTQASQLELGGTEIGTYTDRLRDAVRGGGNNTRDSQGVGNGLLLQPNELQNSVKSREDYNLRMNQLRIGLAGNLAEFPLRFPQTSSKDIIILGRDIPYGDQPTGYALDPADTINYVSKHDNQTLWDNSQYRLAFDVSTDDRVRMHLQSLAFTLFAQGIPFLHMGSEFMRSKSFLRDSYDYSDWFNRVDFSKKNNYYNIGLPPAEKDQDNWPLINTVLTGHEGRDQVNTSHIQLSSNVFKEQLAIRMSSPLFRLTTSESIIEKVSFLNTNNEQLGLLVMKLDDTQGQSVDTKLNSVIVIFNTSTKTQLFDYAGADKYQLHPILQKGSDEVVKSAKTSDRGFSIPALSSVVFVKPN